MISDEDNGEMYSGLEVNQDEEDERESKFHLDICNPERFILTVFFFRK